ncbi:MAG: hypothetical protein ACRCV5_01195, partial [Afipia sp.]
QTVQESVPRNSAITNEQLKDNWPGPNLQKLSKIVEKRLAEALPSASQGTCDPHHRIFACGNAA